MRADLHRARACVDRRERAAWILIGAGLAAWTAGDAFWSFHLSGLEEIRYPSLADAAHLLLFPAIYAGIVLLVRARVPRFHASLWLDGAIGALAIAAVGAALMYPAIDNATQGNASAVATNVAYPLGDLLLVGLRDRRRGPHGVASRARLRPDRDRARA